MTLGSDVHVNNRAALAAAAVLGAGRVGLGGFLRGSLIGLISGGVIGDGCDGTDGAAGGGILRDRAGSRRIAEAGDRRGAVAGDGLWAVGLHADIHARDLNRFAAGGEGGAHA